MIADRPTRSSASSAALERQSDAAAVAVSTHNLKCWPEFFQAILEGRKTHDLRRSDDRVFGVGDRLRLQEFDPKAERYTGREFEVEITYMTSSDVPCALSGKALDPRFCILSIRKLA
jgi:hypothetical protein